MTRSSSKFLDLSFLTSSGYTFGPKIVKNRATKVKFGESVLACKIIKKRNLEDDRTRLETLRLISHPNIISLHSIIQNGDLTCLFTQWADGGNLFVLLKKFGRIKSELVVLPGSLRCKILALEEHCTWKPEL